jgi:hypothetical protein
MHYVTPCTARQHVLTNTTPPFWTSNCGRHAGQKFSILAEAVVVLERQAERFTVYPWFPKVVGHVVVVCTMRWLDETTLPCIAGCGSQRPPGPTQRVRLRRCLSPPTICRTRCASKTNAYIAHSPAYTICVSVYFHSRATSQTEVTGPHSPTAGQCLGLCLFVHHLTQSDSPISIHAQGRRWLRQPPQPQRLSTTSNCV